MFEFNLHKKKFRKKPLVLILEVFSNINNLSLKSKELRIKSGRGLQF